MSGQSHERVLAAVCDPNDPQAKQLSEHLARRGGPAAVFSRRQLDDLDRAVRAGAVSEAVFVRAEDLLEAVWDGRLDYDRWRAAGVRVSLLGVPDGEDEMLQRVLQCWQEWRARQRRRQTIATALLSAAALAAAFVFVWLRS